LSLRIFCVEALEETIARYGTPEIFNTDQGSQFTAASFIDVLDRNNIRISMDGRGAWRDNVFVERLWRSAHNPRSSTYPDREFCLNLWGYLST
jgi:transposase InsO family protein